MNIVDGLAAFKARKNYSNAKIAEMLDCSTSVVSLYLSGKSGLSLEKLALLLKNGMTLTEAFGEDVASAIIANIRNEKACCGDTMEIVIDGLQRILDAVKRPNGL